MNVDISISVGNHFLVDFQIFQHWINGLTASEAATKLQRQGYIQKYRVNYNTILADMLDQWRQFDSIEHYLKNPPSFMEQQIYQILPSVQEQMIEMYYSFDAVVIRELLGKKLTTRDRKDLDDVNEKTHVSLKSCRRQFDNCKRIFKTTEEMMGSLVQNIITTFRLPQPLSEQYAAIVFMTNNRFETQKRKLSYLVLDDFLNCTREIIASWSYSSRECFHHEDMDVDLDQRFLQELREFKILLERDIQDEHKAVAMRLCQQQRFNERTFLDIDSNFKSLSKALIYIATNLNHTKDSRDIFLDLVEKFIEPCKQLEWNRDVVKNFLVIVHESARRLPVFARSDVLSESTWERYFVTVSACILQMYHL